MQYIPVDLTDSIVVNAVYTVHYFEYTSTFSFEGETHPFWEFVFVDKGEVQICMGERILTLQKDEIAFHKPDEFHTVRANGSSAPNLIVISFSCESPAIDILQNQVLRVDGFGKILLANMISEARCVFSSALDDPYMKKMETKDDESIPFGGKQLIRLNLEYFLIDLIRKHSRIVPSGYRPTACRDKTGEVMEEGIAGEKTIEKKMIEKKMIEERMIEERMIEEKRSSRKYSSYFLCTKNDDTVFNEVRDYMESVLYTNLKIDQICDRFMIGSHRLQKIFRSHTGMGMMEYFSNLRIDAAKEQIRTGKLNFTQIADRLGYTSIHYFTKQFKKIAGMTPSEYAASVKAISETFNPR